MNGPLSEAEYEQLRTELCEEPDSDTYNRMKIVPYVMAALAVFTLVCLGAGAWLRGLA